MSARVAFAIAAHPDDIEFMMAGTLLLLKAAGWETHYLNVADGSCGSLQHSAARTRAIRSGEARDAARILGAEWHPSLTRDLEIAYDLKLLRRLAAVVRDVQPSVVLTHSPEDYMEDHMATSRLAVTAAFVRGMPNFVTSPKVRAFADDTTVYHALPHGLRDGLNRRVAAESFVNTTSVQARKREALAAHRSQQSWLDATQRMSSYLQAMEDTAREVGRMSGKFDYAEGWRRHNPLGLCAANADPLRDALGRFHRRNRDYARALEG
jgi:LmbE family N-acetylglucosaminyl deacetylase